MGNLSPVSVEREGGARMGRLAPGAADFTHSSEKPAKAGQAGRDQSVIYKEHEKRARKGRARVTG